MACIIRQRNIFYTYLLISIVSLFFIFMYNSPCRADWRIKDFEPTKQATKHFELADKVAFFQDNSEPQTPGQAGSIIYESAAEDIARRSTPGIRLEPRMKDLLRPYFESLVDRVSVHWETPLLSKWVDTEYSITLENAETQAQAPVRT